MKMIIFDMDGVLVDACEWHRVALNEALQKVCGYEIPKQEHYTIYNGIPTRTKLKILVEKGLIPPGLQSSIYEEKQRITVKTIEKHAEYRNEKVEMIKALKKMGLLVACYTNSIRMTAELMLEKTGVLSYLDFLLTNQDVKNSKPHPEGYIFLVNKFNLKKEDVLIVEDSPKGKKAAYASGCNVLEVSNPDEVNFKLLKEHIS